jgi:hypothetical protein
MRTRHGLLKDLGQTYLTKCTLENVGNGFNASGMALKFAIFNFGSIKQKKMRSKSLQMMNATMSCCDEHSNATILAHLSGAIFWTLELVEDFQYTLFNTCYFGVSKKYVAVVDALNKCVIFSAGSNAIIGWTLNVNDNSFLLYFDQGESINLRFKSHYDMQQAIKRLEHFTKGCRVIYIL